MKKTIHLQYYAILREQRGCDEETLTTSAQTVWELYEQIKQQFNFTLSVDSLKVAINNEFQKWNTQIKDKDTIIFIPPVAGG